MGKWTLVATSASINVYVCLLLSQHPGKFQPFVHFSSSEPSPSGPNFCGDHLSFPSAAVRLCTCWQLLIDMSVQPRLSKECCPESEQHLVPSSRSLSARRPPLPSHSFSPIQITIYIFWPLKMKSSIILCLTYLFL